MLLLLCVDLLVLGVTVLIISSVINARTVSPFIVTRNSLVPYIRETFGTLPKGSRFYELGSGDGRIALAIAKSNPQATCIGIEKYWLPYLVSRIAAWRSRLHNITFIRADMFNISLAEATHIYCYLYPNVMKELFPKFKNELIKNAVVVSLDFVFDEKKADATEALPVDNKTLAKKLFTYRF